MAKKSKIARNKQRQAVVDHYAEKRAQLKADGDYLGLQKLPRDASPTRIHNRDSVDGRPRGYIRKYKMSRIRFRDLAHKGQIPGVRKASW